MNVNFKQKIKAFLPVAMAFLLLFLLIPLSGCNQTEEDNPDQSLNIIDDNYRNWYEVFVYSYYDSDGDGYGDLNGVTAKLDYIQEMGFNGIWLMPVCQSTTYHKYDVVDYYTIDQTYGTNDDFKRLIEEAHSRGIRVIVDMVLNHTSGSHEWFQSATRALQGKGSPKDEKYVEYYNFSDTKHSGYNPVGGNSGKYYESRFDSNMPDLNLDSSAVRQEITQILSYWLTEMNVDGFRLDACTSYYTGNVEKNVEFMRFVTQTSKTIKSDAYLVGEVWIDNDTQIRRYYDSGIDSCFLFTAATGGGRIRKLLSSLASRPGEDFAKMLTDYQTTYNVGSLAPFLCNHDTARAANFLAGENAKFGAGLLSLMNGNTFVYYGDEIGMICSDASSDPSKRIAMRWEDKSAYQGMVYKPPQEGMIVSSKSYLYPSVQTQQQDPDSILSYYKQAMRLRNRHPEIARGEVETLSLCKGELGAIKKTWKGSSVYLFVNFSDVDPVRVDLSVYGASPVLKDSLDLSPKNRSSLSGATLTLQPRSICAVTYS